MRPSRIPGRVGAAAIVVSSVMLAGAPAASAASAPAGGRGTTTTVQIHLNEWTGNHRSAGHRLTAGQAISVGSRAPQVHAWLRRHQGLRAAALPDQLGTRPFWQAAWYRGDTPLILAVVDDHLARVTQVWSGYQVSWAMARGDSHYAGGLLRAWYVWVPLCLLFVLPFIDVRRPWRLLHLDLLVLLAFSASFFLFSGAHISASVPFLYPVFAYLLVRLLIAGFRPTERSERLVPHLPSGFLMAGIVLLVCLRIVLNLANSTTLDVGEAGVAGAHLLLHGQTLYGGPLAQIVNGGDTYGPVNYLAYVPFAGLFHHDQPWLIGHAVSASTHHPAAEAASICFDLLTLIGLIFLGRQLRPGAAGKTLGLALGYAWVAYPFSTFVLQENTNDTLVAALVVITLLAMAHPGRRGVALALAALSKFSPLALVPLIATGRGGPGRWKTWAWFAAGFGLTACVVVLPIVSPGELRTFYHHTIGSQLHRTSPFSIWGQHSSLRFLQRALQAVTILGGLALGFVPRVRNRAQIAALAAAMMVALQVCLTYWYYTYIVWFAPLALVALFATYREAREPAAIDTPSELVAVKPLSVAVLEPVG